MSQQPQQVWQGKVIATVDGSRPESGSFQYFWYSQSRMPALAVRTPPPSALDLVVYPPHCIGLSIESGTLVIALQSGLTVTVFVPSKSPADTEGFAKITRRIVVDFARYWACDAEHGLTHTDVSIKTWRTATPQGPIGGEMHQRMGPQQQQHAGFGGQVAGVPVHLRGGGYGLSGPGGGHAGPHGGGGGFKHEKLPRTLPRVSADQSWEPPPPPAAEGTGVVDGQPAMAPDFGHHQQLQQQYHNGGGGGMAAFNALQQQAHGPVDPAADATAVGLGLQSLNDLGSGLAGFWAHPHQQQQGTSPQHKQQQPQQQPQQPASGHGNASSIWSSLGSASLGGDATGKDTSASPSNVAAASSSSSGGDAVATSTAQVTQASSTLVPPASAPVATPAGSASADSSAPIGDAAFNMQSLLLPLTGGSDNGASFPTQPASSDGTPSAPTAASVAPPSAISAVGANSTGTTPVTADPASSSGRSMTPPLGSAPGASGASAAAGSGGSADANAGPWQQPPPGSGLGPPGGQGVNFQPPAGPADPFAPGFAQHQSQYQQYQQLHQQAPPIPGMAPPPPLQQQQQQQQSHPQLGPGPGLTGPGGGYVPRGQGSTNSGGSQMQPQRYGGGGYNGPHQLAHHQQHALQHQQQFGRGVGMQQYPQLPQQQQSYGGGGAGGSGMGYLGQQQQQLGPTAGGVIGMRGNAPPGGGRGGTGGGGGPAGPAGRYAPGGSMGMPMQQQPPLPPQHQQSGGPGGGWQLPSDYTRIVAAAGQQSAQQQQGRYAGQAQQQPQQQPGSGFYH